MICHLANIRQPSNGSSPVPLGPDWCMKKAGRNGAKPADMETHSQILSHCTGDAQSHRQHHRTLFNLPWGLVMFRNGVNNPEKMFYLKLASWMVKTHHKRYQMCKGVKTVLWVLSMEVGSVSECFTFASLDGIKQKAQVKYWIVITNYQNVRPK